jgi:hypothetical protein
MSAKCELFEVVGPSQLRRPPGQRLAQRVKTHRAQAEVVQVPEVSHEPLGVERPPLAVAGHPGNALPAVQALPVRQGVRYLHMMAGDALVIDDRDLLPGGEGPTVEVRRPREIGITLSVTFDDGRSGGGTRSLDE